MKDQFKLYITLGISLIGSILFYKEGLGINVLLFSIIALFSVFTIADKSRRKGLIPVAASLMLCSVLLLFYPQKITLIIWMIGYLSLWTLVFYDLRPMLIPIQALVSVCVTPFVSFINNKLRPQVIPDTTNDTHFNAVDIERPVEQNIQKNRNGKVYLFSTAIVMFFILLYARANPLVSNVIGKIDLSFLDFGFIAIVVLLFIIHFGLIFFRYFTEVDALNQWSNHVPKKELKEKDHQEFNVGKISIGVITGLLLVINVFDIYTLASGTLPEGLTYSDYVHQGFYTLIFSMSLAIALILYFLRDQLYFHEQIQELKKVMFFWVAQNLILIMITFYKNYLYVQAYGFTYKRIAVFLCLVCVAIGFIVAISKIRHPMSNWYFFNHTTMLAYFSFVVIAILPYDMLITRYNLAHSETTDLWYILSLENPDYASIRNYIEDVKADNPSSNQWDSNLDRRWVGRLNKFMESNEKKSWKSWNYYNANVMIKQ